MSGAYFSRRSPQIKKCMKKSIISLLTLLCAFQANASTITWGTPTSIVDIDDFLTTGTFVEAYNVGGSATTVGGINFTAAATLNASGVTGGRVFSNTFLPFPTTTGDNSYDNLLLGAQIESTYLTIGKGGLLVDGQEYSLQIWVNDSRALAVGRTVSFNTGDNSVTLDVNQGADTLGYTVVGTFIYDENNRFGGNPNTLHLTTSGSAGAVINAYALYAIPEPASFALLAAGLVGALVVVRRRRS